MNKKRIGKRTIKLNNKPTIIAASSIVGPKEGEGPLKDKFDLILSDDLYGEKTWELSESKMVQTVMEMSVKKANKTLEDVDFLFGGDLINEEIEEKEALSDELMEKMKNAMKDILDQFKLLKGVN